MSEPLPPPKSLDHLPYFVLRYDRGSEKYELIEPNKTNSYMLGDAFKTRAYFVRIGMEWLGGKALDSAYAFGASQAIVKEKRAFGLDLTKFNLDAGIIKKEQEREDFFEKLVEPDESCTIW